jgi:ribonuclease G
VIEALGKELKKDRVKTNILGLTQLGLLEMTRKKTGHGLNQMMDRECGCCEGRGRLYNDSMVCLEIRHIVNKEAATTAANAIRVEASPALIQYIKYNKLQNKWENEIEKKIVLKGNENLYHGFVVRPDFGD